MTRVASLYLPQLPIERLKQVERSSRPPDGAALQAATLTASRLSPPIDDNPGTCSVPRGGGWRPGARWARDGVLESRSVQAEIDTLPAHQRPTMREMGRRSEHAEHPFKVSDTVGGRTAPGPGKPLRWADLWGRPMVLIERTGQHDVVTAACPLALDYGLRPGMAAAHARALVGDLDVRDAAAAAEPKHLKRMLGMRIERIDPGLGIEAMQLVAARTELLGPQTLEAGLEDGARPGDIAQLVDQLASRIDPDMPFRLSARESDVPERAVEQIGPLLKPIAWPDWKRPVRVLMRPEQLFNVVALLPDHPPRRFTWRGKVYQVVAGDGPERIHGEWWRRPKEMWAVRDYYRVEAQNGARFWLFRRGDGVDAPTGDLSWHMHGVFG